MAQSALPGIIKGLQRITYVAGWLFGYIGWTAFAAALFCLLLFPTQGREIGKAFHFAGQCLLPAWLLLRLGSISIPFRG
ncbi:MAG: hypothetical protein V4671_29690 [Armatimonadota bacterium]